MKPELRKMLINHLSRQTRVSDANPVATSILETVAAAIVEAGKETERQLNNMDDELIEMGYDAVLTEEYRALSEELLGSAFVVLQRILNTAAQSAVKCSQLAADQTSSTQRVGHKGDAYGHGTKLVGTRTPAQLVNAVANYYKHKDEMGPWSGLSGQSLRTINAVKTLGMVENRSDNLSAATSALGATESDLLPLLVGIATWSKELEDQLRADANLPKVP